MVPRGKIEALPAAGLSHRPSDDASECNALPHEQTPTAPAGRRRSPGPTADPRDQTLKRKRDTTVN